MKNQPRRAQVWISNVIFAATVVALTIAAPAAHAQQQPLRVAIVGLEHGHVAGFLHNLPQHTDVQLVGIAEADTSLWTEYATKDHLPQSLFYKSEANMIERVHPDAVLVYTPVSEHRNAIGIAAQYGISSMVEKPLTISYQDAIAIREIAQHHHVHVLVNYETTWYSSNTMAYDELRSGQIGPVRRVVINDGHKGPKEINVQPEFLRWLTNPEQNGAGALYDFGCYGVDLMTWLMHGQAPLTVTAIALHDKPEIYPHVDDDATILLQYRNAQAVIQPSWNWPFSRKDMEVYGATGYAITVGPDKVRLRQQHDKDEREVTAPELTGANRDSLDYLAAVLSGKVKDQGDLTALDTNVTVMQILDAARESVRTGRTIRLSGE